MENLFLLILISYNLKYWEINAADSHGFVIWPRNVKQMCYPSQK